MQTLSSPPLKSVDHFLSRRLGKNNIGVCRSCGGSPVLSFPVLSDGVLVVGRVIGPMHAWAGVLNLYLPFA